MKSLFVATCAALACGTILCSANSTAMGQNLRSKSNPVFRQAALQQNQNAQQPTAQQSAPQNSGQKQKGGELSQKQSHPQNAQATQNQNTGSNDDDTVTIIRPPVRDPSHITQKNAWSYKELQQKNIVMQQYDYSCGAAVLATIVHYYWGDEADELGVLEVIAQVLTAEELADRVKNGLTLEDLRKVSEKAGYDASLGKLTLAQLAQAKVPVIVGVVVKGHDHFVVYRGQDGQFVYIADPLRGNIRVPTEIFEEQWQKHAILAIAKPNTPVKTVNPLGVRAGEISRGYLSEDAFQRNIISKPIVPNPLPKGP